MSMSYIARKIGSKRVCNIKVRNVNNMQIEASVAMFYFY